MAAVGSVRLRWDERAISALGAEPFTRVEILSAARNFAAAERGLAPKRTGAGAGSIHGYISTQDEPGSARVAWTRQRFYMWFVNAGTKRGIAAQQFVERTLAHYVKP
jgi:hypothetical protein